MDNRKRKAAVFTGGDLSDTAFYNTQLADIQPDLVIGVDKGSELLDRLDVTPDLLVGDFDSIDPAVLKRLKAKGIPTETHPVRKDQTDTELALTRALEAHPDVIYLYGATGTRLDHMLSSIDAMTIAAERDVEIHLIDPHNDLSLYKGPKKITCSLPAGQTVSLLPLSDTAGPVTIAGFDYPLEDATLTRRTSGWTVSNVTKTAPQTIAFETGWLLVDVVLSE